MSTWYSCILHWHSSGHCELCWTFTKMKFDARTGSPTQGRWGSSACLNLKLTFACQHYRHQQAIKWFLVISLLSMHCFPINFTTQAKSSLAHVINAYASQNQQPLKLVYRKQKIYEHSWKVGQKFHMPRKGRMCRKLCNLITWLPYFVFLLCNSSQGEQNQSNGE